MILTLRIQTFCARCRLEVQDQTPSCMVRGWQMFLVLATRMMTATVNSFGHVDGIVSFFACCTLLLLLFNAGFAYTNFVTDAPA